MCNESTNQSMRLIFFHVGNHVVDVLYEGIAVGNTPYTAKCYDPAAIRVSGVGSGMVGKPVEFESTYRFKEIHS